MSQPSTNIATTGPRQAFLDNIALSAKTFARAMPRSVPDVEINRAIDQVMVAYRQAAMLNPELLSCDPASVARAVALSALTGLKPGGPLPDVYLLPQKMNGRLMCDWRISWRGYATLAQRAGYRLRAVEVHEGDTFEYAEGLFPDLKHLPVNGTNTWDTLLAVYVVAHRVGAAHEVPAFMVVSRSTIEARRNASPSRNSGPWQSWPLEMARKAAIRYAIQRGLVPLDDVAAHAYEQDRETVEAVAADAPSYFLDAPSKPAGLAGVVAAAENRMQGSAASPGLAAQNLASPAVPKRGRGRPRKEAAPDAPAPDATEAQAVGHSAVVATARAAEAQLSGAESEAMRDRLGIGDGADLDELTAPQLAAVVREAYAIIDERGGE